MSVKARLIPSGSQTVGPFFRIGLQPLVDEAPACDADPTDRITIRGRVLDRDSAPVPDAMLEFWSAGRDGAADQDGFAEGFQRTATDLDGNFSVTMRRPAPVGLGDGAWQAPHLLVLVFARGLMRHLISRVYFDGESANASDVVLLGVPAARRCTLTALREAENSFCWDVILQGEQETVFFAW
jgi:protocatechuate 3,4-dioxygenase alpha subunit